MKYALIDVSGKVTNVIELETGSDWRPPEGFTYVQSDTAQIGWTYVGGAFVAPPDPVPVPPAPFVPPLKLQAQSALDKTDVTVVRCYSAGVSVPAEIQSYRMALRAIANGTDTTSTALPTPPPSSVYPANT